MAGDAFAVERGCDLRSGATKDQPQRARCSRRAFRSTLLRLVFDTFALRPKNRFPYPLLIALPRFDLPQKPGCTGARVCAISLHA